MLKNVLRYSLGIGIIAIVGAVALYGVSYWSYKNSPEYQAKKNMRELERQYAEDPYGGDTPEETLRLFIEALKAGDTDLAAKYFVLDEQEKWKRDLARIKEEGLLDEMMKDLVNAKKYSSKENQAIFTAGNDKDEAVANIVIVRAYTRWKIQDI